MYWMKSHSKAKVIVIYYRLATILSCVSEVGA